MDSTLANSFIAGGSSGVILGGFYIIYKIFKHSSCKSNCCGHKSSLTVDLEKGLNSPSETPETSEEKKKITT